MNYSAAELRRIKGLKTDAVREVKPQWLSTRADWQTRYPHLATVAHSRAAIALPLKPVAPSREHSR